MKAFLPKLSQRNHWTANLTPAAKSSRFFVARGTLHMVSFGQRFRVVEKSHFTTFLLLLAASISVNDLEQMEARRRVLHGNEEFRDKTGYN